MKKVYLFVLLFLVFGFWCTPPAYPDSGAEYYDPDSRISMDVVFGFNSNIKHDSYNSSVFFIKNDGDDFSGVLSVKVNVGYTEKGPFTVDSKKIFLPALSKKRIYVYFDSGKRSASTSIKFELTSDSGKSIFSADLVKEKMISVISGQYSNHRVSGFLTVVISDKNYGYNFLSGVNPVTTTTAIPTGGNYLQIQNHSVNYPPYETLPDDSAGYDGVNLIVLSHVSTAKLTTDQKRAILRYVNEGGNVLITKSESDLWLQDDFAKKLMPGRLTGEQKTMETIGGFGYNTGKTTAIFSTSMINTTAYQVLDIKPAGEDEIFASFEGIPVILKREIGEGTVFFTAFDPSIPPFAGRKETLEILGNVFNSLNMIKGVSLGYTYDYAITSIFNNLVNSLMTKDVIKKVVVFFLISFFAYVIILGPLNYFVLKRKKRLEYAWFTMPAISILFSTVFLVSGYTTRGTKNYLFTYNIVKTYNENNFRVNSFFSAFASTAGDYDIEIENQNILVRHHDISYQDEMKNYSVEISDAIRMKDVDINKWSVSNFMISGYLYENTDYNYSVIKDGETRELEYDFPFELQKIFFVSNGRVNNVSLKSPGKAGTVMVDLKKLDYYKRLVDFTRSDIVDFSSWTDGSASTSKKHLTVMPNIDMITFLKNKGFIDDDEEYFLAFTNDNLFKYELNDVSFSRIDNSLIIIPVE